MTVGGVIATLIGGIVIGLLARLVVPGKQGISMLVTIIIGIIGSFAGYWIYRQIGGGDTGGIDWIAFAIGIGVAAVLVTLYVRFAGGKRG